MAHVANAAIKEDVIDFELTKNKLIRNSGVRLIGQGDNLGDVFGVRIFQDGVAFNLAGYSVQGYFIRQNGTTVLINGSALNGNVAIVTLPQACYVYEGPFSLAIKIVGTVTETLRVIDGVVTKTTTETMIDPGSVVPDISQLLAKIQQMEQATAAANTAATNANNVATNIIAPAYSTSATYAVGNYCIYNGYLYRCKTAITTAEEWTAAHWTNVKLGDDVADLKSAINGAYAQALAIGQELVYPESTDFMDGVNLINFLSSDYNTVFNVPNATIIRGHRCLRIVNNGNAELIISIPIAFKTNGRHFGLFQYEKTQSNTNIRLYNDTTLVAGFGSTRVTIDGINIENTYTIRFYLGVGEDLKISSATLYANGAQAYIREEYLNKLSDTFWTAKRSYTLTPWNVGTINGDGTINSTVTTLRYSSVFPIFAGRTYAMDNAKAYSSVKIYDDDNPVIGTTVPAQSLPGNVSSFTAPITGYAVIVCGAGNISDTVISTFDIVTEEETTTKQFTSDILAISNQIGNAPMGTAAPTITGAIAELDNAVDGMNTAESTDVGKALKVKTVSDGKVTEWEFGENGGSTETRVVVEQREIVNSVQKQVIQTQIEEVSGARFASLHGVLPSNTASQNSAALQSLLDDGGTIIVDVPGTYDFAECLMIGSNTTLICFDGVYFTQNNAGGIILNKGALTKEYDTNITIKGLNFIDGNHAGSSSTFVYGLRGKIAFYYAKNVRIENVSCLDLDAYIYFIHIACFENVCITGCTIKGQKDGIHVSRGQGLTIRDCVIGTHDDEIALNAHDYIDGCPELGWIKNVLIENCVNEAADGVVPGSRGIYMLGGAWLDWASGNQYQRGDTVVAQNGYVYRLIADASVDGNNNPVLYTSTVEPIHSSGNETYSDGITWRCVQHDTMYNCGLENVTIRNYTFNVRHDSLFLLNADIGRFSRGVYPGAYAAPYKNITIDNVVVNPEVQTTTPAFINLSYPCDMLRVKDCEYYGYSVLRAQYKDWETINGNNVYRLNLSGNRFKASMAVEHMLIGYFQQTIMVNCDAVQNFIDEAMRTNLVSGSSIIMMRDNLLT